MTENSPSSRLTTRAKRIRRWIFGLTAGVLIIAGSAAAAINFVPPLLAEEYASFEAPDGACRIVVYRNPRLFAMPGQGSDAPGRIDLVDKNGKVLKSRPIEMVQLISKPVWKKGSVSMKLLFDWKMGP